MTGQYIPCGPAEPVGQGVVPVVGGQGAENGSGRTAAPDAGTGAGGGRGESAEARVRRVLVAALDGLEVPAGKGGWGRDAAARAATLADLVRRLAYLDEERLAALAALVLRQAGGVAGPGGRVRWPAPAVILAWAYAMCPPPPRENDYARSLMRSRMGALALDEGWHVELFRVAKVMGPPPGAYVVAQMKARASDMRARLARCRERIAEGVASEDDARFVAWFHREAAEAEALVAEGAAGRQVAGEAEGRA